jgi:hypothetical protein
MTAESLSRERQSVWPMSRDVLLSDDRIGLTAGERWGERWVVRWDIIS